MKKNNIFIGMAVLMVLAMSSCSDYTDIQPKGKNLLTNVSDLDMLLNYEYDASWRLPSMVVNDIYPYMSNYSNTVSAPVKAINYYYWTWDDDPARNSLIESDNWYNYYYHAISKVANSVIAKADEAEGDRQLAMRYKAEAYVIRAWFAYLAVNRYAKAYDPQKADQTPGVCYPLETEEVGTAYTRYSVAEVYDMILKDLDTALGMNALDDVPENQMRMSKVFALAAKAKVLMSMQRFNDALQCARQSLELNNQIYDHRPFLQTGVMVRKRLEVVEDLFMAPMSVSFYMATNEFEQAVEPGTILVKALPTEELYARLYYGMEGYMEGGYSDYGLMHPEMYDFNFNFHLNSDGLTTADMHLTEAECLLRGGNIDEAMNVLDKVRVNRIDPEIYKPLKGNVTSKEEAIIHLKQAYRLEGFCTMKTFCNMKRWNIENDWKETLTKTINGDTYTLSPESRLWVFPFPINVLSTNPNLSND